MRTRERRRVLELIGHHVACWVLPACQPLMNPATRRILKVCPASNMTGFIFRFKPVLFERVPPCEGKPVSNLLEILGGRVGAVQAESNCPTRPRLRQGQVMRKRRNDEFLWDLNRYLRPARQKGRRQRNTCRDSRLKHSISPCRLTVGGSAASACES